MASQYVSTLLKSTAVFYNAQVVNWTLTGSYSAFCRNYGNHSTRTVGYRNWNKEALSDMVEDLETPWQTLELSLQERQTQVVEFVETTTDTAIEKFGEQLPFQFLWGCARGNASFFVGFVSDLMSRNCFGQL